VSRSCDTIIARLARFLTKLHHYQSSASGFLQPNSDHDRWNDLLSQFPQTVLRPAKSIDFRDRGQNLIHAAFGKAPCTGYFAGTNGNGKQYVYGFRVPLLVIGAYTKQTTGVDGYTGYISGPSSDPSCSGTNYCHDFGSILNFIEYAFGTGGYPLGIAPGQFGISQSQDWPYADYFAMDYVPHQQYSYSLSDFFNFSQSNFHAFQTINGWRYPPSCFHVPTGPNCFPGSYPQDPDDDASESD
jgi:hypothetical protein